MEVFLELILEIVGELFFVILGEAMAHLFAAVRFHGETSEDNGAVGRSLIRGSLFGYLLGALSLFVVRSSILKAPDLQLVNLVLSPLIVGVWTMSLGIVDRKTHKRPSAQDTFVFGASFGFAFAAIRWAYFWLQ